MFDDHDPTSPETKEEHNARCKAAIVDEYMLPECSIVSYRGDHCVGMVNDDRTKGLIRMTGRTSFGSLNLSELSDFMSTAKRLRDKHGFTKITANISTIESSSDVCAYLT